MGGSARDAGPVRHFPADLLSVPFFSAFTTHYPSLCLHSFLFPFAQPAFSQLVVTVIIFYLCDPHEMKDKKMLIW